MALQPRSLSRCTRRRVHSSVAEKRVLPAQGMPSCRDVARLNDLLHTLVEVASQGADLQAAAAHSPVTGPRHAVSEAATEVFMEMSQQVHPADFQTARSSRTCRNIPDRRCEATCHAERRSCSAQSL